MTNKEKQNKQQKQRTTRWVISLPFFFFSCVYLKPIFMNMFILFDLHKHAFFNIKGHLFFFSFSVSFILAYAWTQISHTRGCISNATHIHTQPFETNPKPKKFPPFKTHKQPNKERNSAKDKNRI